MVFALSAIFHLSLTIKIRLVTYMRKAAKSEQPYQWILNEYPPVITKEQVWRLCHVSKKTALHYLQNGLIPCERTGKQTHSYLIKTADVVHFLRTRDQTPVECQAPAGWYKQRNRKYVHSLSPAMREKLHKALGVALQSFPDVLTVKQVCVITGYTDSTVVKWCKSGCLHHFRVQGKNRIPQISLLEFLAGRDYRGISAKSKSQMLLAAKGQAQQPSQKS